MKEAVQCKYLAGSHPNARSQEAPFDHITRLRRPRPTRPSAPRVTCYRGRVRPRSLVWSQLRPAIQGSNPERTRLQHRQLPEGAVIVRFASLHTVKAEVHVVRLWLALAQIHLPNEDCSEASTALPRRAATKHRAPHPERLRMAASEDRDWCHLPTRRRPTFRAAALASNAYQDFSRRLSSCNAKREYAKWATISPPLRPQLSMVQVWPGKRHHPCH